ncbi:hypothetical protein H9Y04_00335 [Streptomyces sp. TRM66268-LWL]|uniref:Tetratricopeptide repeat protein n=1 Tax=Streptomyces polyasparticus TaxID=2767826 RepID=A0ABR7S6C2_9ACTN|nr:hypothetical protein [Streptomyces polyasparticus]MBC9711021.1 hypothetical protein [Streptomyces polyasparticus]
MPTAPLPQNTDELYAALRDNGQRPYGRTRTVTAEELVDAAEQFDDPAALVCALLELQSAYTYGSEPRKSPVVFARILNLYDEQPDVFDDSLRHQLFWRFKWVANALLALPEVPLPTLRQWLTEMRDRYTKADLDLQPYYGQAYDLAAHIGEGADLAYDLWASRVRTRLSDCEACEICTRARYHLGAGDDARALRIWEPVLSGKDSCQEEPARSVSYALLPLLRTGQTDRARELHLAGYRACRRNASMAGEVGRHLEFCALTGNEARGLELLSENRTLFEEVDSPSEQLDFLTGVEVLLQRVEFLGHGELACAGYAGRAWTVSALRAEVRGRADDLAARFDARNGTTTQSAHRRARLECAPLLDALELTLRPRELDDLVASDEAVPAAAPVRRTAALPESLSELILRARELHAQGHPGDAACWARLRVLTAARDYRHPEDPAVGPLLQLRADLLTDEAYTARSKDEFDEAVALHEEAAGLYEDAGLAGDAAVAQACALLAAAEAPVRDQSAEPADETAQIEALTAAHAAMVRLQEETLGLTPLQEARLLRLRASAHGIRLQASRSEEHIAPAFAELGLLQEFAARHGLANQSSGAGLLHATLHALSGNLPAAVTEIDALLARLRAEGPAWHLPRTLGLRGRIQLGLQDPEAAYKDLTEALRAAGEWPADADDRGRIHQDLAETCMHLGRPDEALRHLTRAAEQHLRYGSRVDGFCAYSNAAQLSVDLDRVEDAIALLDSVLAEPDIAKGELDDRLTAQLRLTRARALHAGGDLKAATAEFAELAAESAGWDDDPGSHAMIAGETAVVLAEGGEFGPARAALGQALAAHAKSPRYEQISNHLREVARLQAKHQGMEGLRDARAVLADAERVAVAADKAGFTPQGRSLESALAYEHGRVNAYAGEYESALAALDQACALLGEFGPGDDRLGEWTECVRLAGAVEGLYMERTAPALARVDAAITRLTALGATEEAAPLRELAAQIRDE